MARAGQMSGRAPRVSAASLARAIGVETSVVRQYQKMAKSYNDAARKWGKRHGVDTSAQWKPMSPTAISRSPNPGEYFKRAFANVRARLEEGVSNLLNTRAKEYADNLASAMAASTQFDIDRRMQNFVNQYQSGRITPYDVLAATGGRPLTALYSKHAGGGVEIDFSEILDLLDAAFGL